MAKKKTSATASTVAARVLATDNPLDAHRGAIAIAIQECGLPLSERAVSGFVDRIEAALAPMLEDMKTLAGSALSQDEETSIKAPLPAGVADTPETRARAQAACESGKDDWNYHD